MNAATRPTPPAPAPADWQRLLSGVARSFALSVKVLPTHLRAPVTLGYLLARASDTLADSVPAGTQAMGEADLRVQALAELRRCIAQVPQGRIALELDLPKVAQCLPGIASAPERLLLQRLPEVLQSMGQLSPSDQQLIGKVCETIASGQELDLLRFGAGAAQVQGLSDQTELDDYTWRVAGCVGQFWTDLAESHLSDWRSQPLSNMQHAAKRYGMGLQRLNLWRDSAADLAQGRCYWPADRLAQHGLEAATLAQAVAQRDMAVLARMGPCVNQGLSEIRRDLSWGLAYSLAVRPWRLRMASALPALIGLRTVQALESAGIDALLQSVRVPRSWVRGLMLKLMLGGLTIAGLSALGRSVGALRVTDWARPSGPADGTISP